MGTVGTMWGPYICMHYIKTFEKWGLCEEYCNTWGPYIYMHYIKTFKKWGLCEEYLRTILDDTYRRYISGCRPANIRIYGRHSQTYFEIKKCVIFAL